MWKACLWKSETDNSPLSRVNPTVHPGFFMRLNYHSANNNSPHKKAAGKPGGTIQGGRYGFLLPQGQEFCRVHGLVLTGHAEVDMAAQGGFHQCRRTGIANGLSHGHRIPGADCQIG